jgi:ATP-binding cassette, subfamily B, bacterial
MSPERPEPSSRRGLSSLLQLWSRLGPYLAGNRLRMALFAVVSLLRSVLEALLLFAVVRAATGIAAGEDRIQMSFGPVPQLTVTIGEMLAWSLGLLGIMVVLTVASSYLAARLSEVALIGARRRTFDAFVAASWDVRSRDRNGYLQELLTTHAKKVGTGAAVLADGVAAGLGFVAFLCSALFINPVAAVTILVGVLVLYVSLRPVTRLTRTKSRAHVASNAAYAMALTEAAALARELRVFDADDVVASQVNHRAVDTGRLSFSTRFLGKLAPSLYQDAALLLVILGMAGAYAFTVGDLSSLGAVILLLVRALNKSQGIQSAIQQSSEVAPYLERLTDQTSIYTASQPTFGSKQLGPVESIEFDHVSFGYDSERTVLHDLSFVVRQGETIGIVGPSGSGKSTLVQLLLRLRSPDVGSHTVNGLSAGDYTSRSWAAQVGFVPQDNALLHASVADNVRFYRPWITDELVERACRLAHVHEEVLALPWRPWDLRRSVPKARTRSGPCRESERRSPRRTHECTRYAVRGAHPVDPR